MAVIQKLRKSFGKSFLQTPLPDLVEIQYNSYRDFLQADVAPENRKNMQDERCACDQQARQILYIPSCRHLQGGRNICGCQ